MILASLDLVDWDRLYVINSTTRKELGYVLYTTHYFSILQRIVKSKRSGADSDRSIFRSTLLMPFKDLPLHLGTGNVNVLSIVRYRLEVGR